MEPLALSYQIQWLSDAGTRPEWVNVYGEFPSRVDAYREFGRLKEEKPSRKFRMLRVERIVIG